MRNTIKGAPLLCLYRCPIMHWGTGIGPLVWTLDAQLIRVGGPCSKCSKTSIVVRFGVRTEERFSGSKNADRKTTAPLALVY